MLYNIIPIAIGAVLGAILRWLFSIWFSTTISSLALGTLIANWLGAFVIGILAELIHHQQWRLLLITGFLGSLTTFSGFSLEIVTMLQEHRWSHAFLTTSLHLIGSLILTALGIMIVQSFK